MGAGIRVGLVCAFWDDPAGALEDLVAWGADVWAMLCELATQS